MKTLNDYILDAQAREARFLKSPSSHTEEQWKAYQNSRAKVLTTAGTTKVDSVLQPNYVTEDGIPCHNRATALFYKNNK